ncbi:vWA domain-containing protein [Nocardioides montaniterrae]
MIIARRIAIVIALILVLADPGFGSAKVPSKVADLQLLVVVDRTRSMSALDGEGGQPRITAVRHDLKALADAMPGARFALLTFGFDARLELPFTTDANAFLAEADTLTLERPTAGIGSMLDKPKTEMIQVLQAAHEQYPTRRQLVVFISDGEQTGTQTAPPTMQEVGSYVDGGVVLGYGTKAGGPMPMAEDLSRSQGYLIDPTTHRTAVSHEDPETLKTLAGQLGVPFVQRGAPGGMDRIAADLKKGSVAVAGGPPGTHAHDLTWLFGLILLGLVLLELRDGWRMWWRSER